MPVVPLLVDLILHKELLAILSSFVAGGGLLRLGQFLLEYRRESHDQQMTERTYVDEQERTLIAGMREEITALRSRMDKTDERLDEAIRGRTAAELESAKLQSRVIGLSAKVDRLTTAVWRLVELLNAEREAAGKGALTDAEIQSIAPDAVQEQDEYRTFS